MFSNPLPSFSSGNYKSPGSSYLREIADIFGGSRGVCRYAGVTPDKWNKYLTTKNTRGSSPIPYAVHRLLSIAVGESRVEKVPAFMTARGSAWLNTYSSGSFSPPPHTEIWKWLDHGSISRDAFGSFIGVTRSAVSHYLAAPGYGFKSKGSWPLGYAQTRLMLMGAGIVLPEAIPQVEAETPSTLKLSNITSIDGVVLTTPARRGNGPVIFLIGWKPPGNSEPVFKNTQHFDVEVWGDLGDNILLKGLQKGSLVTVSGGLHHGHYKRSNREESVDSFSIRSNGVFPFENNGAERVYLWSTPSEPLVKKPLGVGGGA